MVTLKLIAVIVSLLNPEAKQILTYNGETFIDKDKCEAVAKEQEPKVEDFLKQHGLVVGTDVSLEMKCVPVEGRDA